MQRARFDPAAGASFDGRFVDLDGGTFLMGTDSPEAIRGDGEGPARPVTVEPFSIAATAVTVAEFRAFVEATGFQTDAERFGWSFVFHLHLPADHPPTQGLASAPWWRQVHGADWAHPQGPGSSTEGRDDHPAVHVSRDDALAYCAWAGLRLPTEAEWEFAARGGLEGARYPWGDDLMPGGQHRCNIFQGDFPVEDTAEDGWAGTAPVDAFPPNGFGLYNAAGNVWEWCADPFLAPNASPGEVVVRGGSHLCHRSYCDRYRVAARTGNTPDSSLSHTGFRAVRDR
ncbi:MAG: formylglycine-generating enzyme family protein [Solirubrobacteraceae bacterium]|nr:formylglycine-generating enzyme family protein [Solirubrobacteraceae bacterium]